MPCLELFAIKLLLVLHLGIEKSVHEDVPDITVKIAHATNFSFSEKELES